MDIQEISTKNEADLMGYLQEQREELRKLRFGVSGSGMRNNFAIRNLRRNIARTLTELNLRSKQSEVVVQS